MKQRGSILSLALFLSLLLCACGTVGAGDTAPEGEGIWSQVTDADWTLTDYDLSACQNPTQVPEDWTLPQDMDLGPFTRVEVCGDLILYGSTEEMAMPDGFTVARYDSGALEPVYVFDEGMTVTWQNFFSPDGKHIAFPWKADGSQTGGWQIRVADLETGVTEDVTPPQWEEEISLLCVKWYDDTSLQVTAIGTEDGDIDAGSTIHWIYTFPAAQ